MLYFPFKQKKILHKKKMLEAKINVVMENLKNLALFGQILDSPAPSRAKASFFTPEYYIILFLPGTTPQSYSKYVGHCPLFGSYNTRHIGYPITVGTFHSMASTR